MDFILVVDASSFDVPFLAMEGSVGQIFLST
jgi:hypothetical protein